MDKNEIGLAGEFFVLAQLARQGYIATLTLGHAKGVDILVSDSRFKSLYRLEVKTTQKGTHYERLFGKSKFYGWPMSLKHESMRDDNLYYCFVCLGNIDEMPKFFIVPSKKVAKYVRWQHRYWLKSRGLKKGLFADLCGRGSGPGTGFVQWQRGRTRFAPARKTVT